VHVARVFLEGWPLAKDNVSRSWAVDNLVPVIAIQKNVDLIASAFSTMSLALLIVSIVFGTNGVDPSQVIGRFDSARVREREQQLVNAIARESISKLGGVAWSCVVFRIENQKYSIVENKRIVSKRWKRMPFE